EAFDSMGLSEIRLEVFNHNSRAIAAYRKVGFEVTGEHVEWVPRRKTELRVVEMRLSRGAFLADDDADSDSSLPNNTEKQDREARQRRQIERKATRAKRAAERAGRGGQPATNADSLETKSAAEPTDPD
ncbi:MAG: hypothetical protein K0R44_1076, partial [Thermomicrobiales bacterium]|nr:hypothetical protein [Thermomicrobiales bacterium]